MKCIFNINVDIYEQNGYNKSEVSNMARYTLTKELSEFLKKLRTTAGLTTRDITDQLGKAPSWYNNYENNTVDSITHQTLMDLFELFYRKTKSRENKSNGDEFDKEDFYKFTRTHLREFIISSPKKKAQTQAWLQAIFIQIQPVPMTLDLKTYVEELYSTSDWEKIIETVNQNKHLKRKSAYKEKNVVYIDEIDAVIDNASDEQAVRQRIKEKAEPLRTVYLGEPPEWFVNFELTNEEIAEKVKLAEEKKLIDFSILFTLIYTSKLNETGGDKNPRLETYELLSKFGVNSVFEMLGMMDDNGDDSEGDEVHKIPLYSYDKELYRNILALLESAHLEEADIPNRMFKLNLDTCRKLFIDAIALNFTFLNFITQEQKNAFRQDLKDLVRKYEDRI